jgi:transitional endoplasmic reticulum ATPase
VIGLPDSVHATVANLEKAVTPNTVFVSKTLAKMLELTPGDVVELEGRKKHSTIAIVSGIEKQEDLLIYPDGYVRINANIGINEKVAVKKVENIDPAESIVIGPSSVNQELTEESSILKDLLTGFIVCTGQIIELPYRPHRAMGGNPSQDTVLVVEAKPNKPVQITSKTNLVIRREYSQSYLKRISDLTYDKVGGLQEQIDKLRYLVEIPLRNPELENQLGVSFPKGVLLYGPPGCGKTQIIRALINESHVHSISLSPTDLSGVASETCRRIKETFAEAKENQPSIIFLDEIDMIVRKRDESYDPDSPRMLGSLLTEMDGLKERGNVIVIAATNRRDSLDEALRRPGRFDIEVLIPIPSEDSRYEILQIHTRKTALDDNVDLKELAGATPGYSGADLYHLVRMAAIRWVERHNHLILPDGRMDQAAYNDMKLLAEDFRKALTLITPSCGREYMIEVPKVKWENVGGLGKIKDQLVRELIKPQQYRKEAKFSGVKLPRGFLFYGPPGCGKTYIAKAIATETKMKVIEVRGSDIFRKYLGESETEVRRIFETARKASPVLIIFEEIDAIGLVRGSSAAEGESARTSILNELLTQLEGLHESSDIIVIGTTNRRDRLDPALIRPGRIELQILIPQPDEDGRKEILKIYTNDLPIANDVDLTELAKLTEGQTGAGIELFVREALNLRFNECLRHYESATQTGSSHPTKHSTQEPVPKTLIEVINETPLSMRHFKEASGCLPNRGGKDASVPS